MIYEYGVDYSFDKPDPVALAADGMTFVMAYVGPGSDGKHFTRAEVLAHNAVGTRCALLVEGAADGAKQGYSAGVQHATMALNMCRDRGFPTGRPYYFAVDYDVAAAGWPAPREYLRGAGSVVGPELVGVYGKRDVMAWAMRDGVARWCFQTYAWSDPNHDGVIDWFAGNHVEQYRNGVALAGGTVDLCRAVAADFGQWSLLARGEDMPARFTFQGFPDEALYSPKVPGGRSRTHVTCGPTYYVQPYSEVADKKKTEAGYGPIVNLTPATSGQPTYAAAVEVYLGVKAQACDCGDGGSDAGVSLDEIKSAAHDGAQAGATAALESATVAVTFPPTG